MERDEAFDLLALARRAEPELTGPHAADWLDWIEREHEGLDAAVRWFIARSMGAEAVALVAAIWRYWLTRGDAREGRAWLAAALNAPGADVPSGARAKALYGAGLLAFRQGDTDATLRLNEESLAVARAVDDKAATVEALGGLARVALRNGDYAAVRAHCEEAMALARESGERGAEALPLHLLAAVTRLEGDYGGARRLYLASIQLNGELGNRRMVGMEHVNLGCVEVLADDPEAAAPHLRDGLRAVRDQGDRGIIPVCLIGLASVAVARGDGERAARLLGATAAELERTASALDPDDRPLYDAAMERTRAALDAEAFAAAWAAGRGITLEAAATYALDEAAPR